MDAKFFISNLWRWKCGLPELDKPEPPTTLQGLRKTEWSNRFEELMRNRLIQGAFKYGRMNYPDKLAWDRLTSMEKRVKLYRETGNTEYLVDIANLALVEFEEGKHPNKHFSSNGVDAVESVKPLPSPHVPPIIAQHVIIEMGMGFRG